jgi:hypothetical protein
VSLVHLTMPEMTEVPLVLVYLDSFEKWSVADAVGAEAAEQAATTKSVSAIGTAREIERLHVIGSSPVTS